MSRETYKKAGYRLLEWLLSAAFLYSTLFLYLSDYPVYLPERRTLFITGAITAFSFLCFYGGSRRKRYILLYEGIFIAYGLLRIKKLAMGFCLFINPWLSDFTKYYEIEEIQFAVEELKTEETAGLIMGFLAFVLFFLAPIVTRMVCFGKGVVWFALAGSITLAMKLLTGKVPETRELLLWMVLFVTLLGTSRRGQKEREDEERIKTVFFMAGILYILCAFVGSRFTPEFYEQNIDLKEPKQKLQTAGTEFMAKLPSVSGLSFGGASEEERTFLGLSRGNLKNGGSLSYTGETRLKITYPKQDRLLEPMFLRSYVGDIYTGDGFKPSEVIKQGESYKKLKKELAAEGIFVDSMELIPLLWLNMDTREITIENVNAGKNRVFAPYWMAEPVEIGRDGMIKLTGRKPEKKYDLTVSADVHEAQSILHFYNMADSPEAIVYDSALKRYIGQVQEVYLQLPKESRLAEKVKKDRYEVLYGGNASGAIVAAYETDRAAEYVRKTLKETAVYSLTAEKVPAEEDFADYFFFQSKKGYCMHFAATATVMFRALGIPARYVEGYVVNGKMIRMAENQTEMGETVELFVPDRNAHAWVEIFDDTAGWIPVEVTPGYNGNGSLAEIEQLPIALTNPETQEIPEPEETKLPEETEIQEETKEPEETKVPEETKPPEEIKEPEIKEPKDTETKAGQGIWARLFLTPVLFIMAVFGGIYAYWGLLRYKKKRKWEKASGAEKIKLYYGEILKYLAEKGVVYKGEPVARWSSRVRESKIPYTEEFEAFAGLAYKAAFGQEIKDEEEKTARRYYQSFWRKNYQSFSRKERIFYKYFRVFGEL